MPPRKCIGCGKTRDSSEMIRITRLHNTGEVLVNPDSTYFGRSSYICYNNECIQNAIKKKKIGKSLRKEVPPQIIEQIKQWKK